MAKRDLFLSVDIGTSAAKAVLFDTDLNQVSMSKKPYPILTPYWNWSEQEPEAIFTATWKAIREIIKTLPTNTQILGISFCAQIYSTLAVDKDIKPISNALTWFDTRSAEEAKAIRAHPAAQKIIQATGCPIDAIYPLSKVLWLKDNLTLSPDTKFISIKDYVLYKLTGKLISDWSNASSTGMFDIHQYDWDQTALEVAGLTREVLPELVSPRTVLHHWDEEVIKLTGLKQGTPLIIGGADGPCASIGVGAFDTSTLAVNVGTSAAARTMMTEDIVDTRGRLWTFVVDEGMWVMGGMVSSGGVVYEWWLNNLYEEPSHRGEPGIPQRVHTDADESASLVSPGAENLIFIPYLAGEQCPDWNPHTRGSIIGLDLRHTRNHIIRAVLEGITRSLFRVSESIYSLLDGDVKEIRVTGGLTHSPTWLQIAADMFGAPVALPESVEGSARGAAMLAMVALGEKSDLESFKDSIRIDKYFYPQAEATAYYRKQYPRFLDLLKKTR